MLRQALFEGEVVLDFVIDTLGQVDSTSVRIVSSSHPLFDSAAREAILGSVYTPARVRGERVRVRVQQSLQFAIQ
jgi:TonB family protein